ncbi:MAG: hypothetical protein Q4C64_04305 [Erysipelotrichia bacterium]|nr:hypothetical protein [Erysipelotrichia bacterium]
MKKLFIIFIVLTMLFGCKANNEDPNNTDKQEERLWIVPEYQSLDYDTYYQKEKILTQQQVNLEIHAVDSRYGTAYDIDAAKGLFIEFFPPDPDSQGLEYQKQYVWESDDAYKYKGIGRANGYWFYLQKSTGKGDALVRTDYLGKEQFLMDNFAFADCYDICYPDDDVLYILKYDSFNQDYTVKLYRIYQDSVVDEIDSGILAADDWKPSFEIQESSYHILYKAENPDYTAKKQYFSENPEVLNQLLAKYNVQLKEASPATDQYNSFVYHALIQKEYGINFLALFDYNVMTKKLTYVPVDQEYEFPTDEYNPYK